MNRANEVDEAGTKGSSLQVVRQPQLVALALANRSEANRNFRFIRGAQLVMYHLKGQKK